MNAASFVSSIVFVGIVGAVALLCVIGWARSVARGARMGGLITGVGVVAVYLGPPAVLARAGLLDRYDPLPAPALLLVAAIGILTTLLAFSPVGARIAASAGLATLIAYQSFRIPVEWVLHRLGVEGVIPIEMTYAGRNLDVVSGVTAALLGGWLLSGGRVPSWVVWAWNVLGLALLANIVTVAILSTPVPFRYFTGGPPNRLPSTFPWVWLPCFLVPAALFGHLLVFRVLASRGRRGR